MGPWVFSSDLNEVCMAHRHADWAVLPVQVLVQEVEAPVEHTISVGARASVLAELKVESKAVKPKGKPGRKKKVVLEEPEDEDAPADAAPARPPGGEPAGAFTLSKLPLFCSAPEFEL
jgi:hypothetical protein